jgi:hypothetical protein
MKQIVWSLLTGALLLGGVAYVATTIGRADEEAAPIYSVKIPAGYHD